MSKDEEYFRILVCGKTPRSPIARRAWDEKVLDGSLAHSPGLATRVLGEMIVAQVQTPAGLYLGRARVMTFEEKRIQRVLRKIVQGLYWYQMRQRMPPDVNFVCPKRVLENPEMLDILRSVDKWQIGDGKVFGYAFAVLETDPRVQFWWLVFYERHVFQVIVLPNTFPH